MNVVINRQKVMVTKGDGDQLTFIAVKNPDYHKFFLTMSPTYTFIDRANGKFNEAMDFKKDYAAILSAAWEIDTAYDQFLNNPDEHTYGPLVELGLDIHPGSATDDDEWNNILSKLIKTPKSNKFRQRFIGDMTEEDLPNAELLEGVKSKK